jgi:hypothetical protein
VRPFPGRRGHILHHVAKIVNTFGVDLAHIVAGSISSIDKPTG